MINRSVTVVPIATSKTAGEWSVPVPVGQQPLSYASDGFGVLWNKCELMKVAYHLQSTHNEFGKRSQYDCKTNLPI